MTKRQKARWEQERTKQRRVVIMVSAVVAIAVALIGIGIFVDKIVVPRETLAEIGDQEISNADYQSYRKIAQAQRAVSYASQAVQFAQFQQQGGDQFTPQITADIAALKLKSAPLDYEILDQMITDRVVASSAAAEGVTSNDEELQRALAKRFATSIQASEATIPVSPTAAISGTAGLSSTAALTPTAPTATPPPTETPTLDKTVTQVDGAIRNYYDTLAEFLETNTQYGNVKTPFTFEEFKQFVIDQERIQLLREKIGIKLVDESQATKEVYADADEILVRVTVDVSDTTDITETAAISLTAWTEGKARIDTIAAELRNGKDFDAVRLAKSDGKDDPNWPQGMRPLTEYAAFNVTEPISTQEIGVIGEPYRGSDGWHIVRVTQRELRPSQSDLETKRGEAISKWVDEKKAATQIVRHPEPTPTAAPPTIDPALLPPTEAPTTAPSDGGATPTAAEPAPTGSPAEGQATPEATPTP